MAHNLSSWKARIQRLPFMKNAFKTAHERMVDKWYADNAESKRYDYPLAETSIVVDVGGYRGEWAERIVDLYHPFLYIFEPVSQYAEALNTLFADNHKVRVYPYGLSDTDRVAFISIHNEDSSVFKEGNARANIELKKASDFFKATNIVHVDLIKINIEGGEYSLLEDLISSGMITMINNLQIQFHDFVPNAKKRMGELRNKLAQTHYPTYQYEFVWENWRKK